MVAVKVKLTSGSNQPVQEKKAIKSATGAPSFKIYAEPDRAKFRNHDTNDSESKRKSVSLNGRRCETDQNTLKSYVKKPDKIKGKLDNSVKVNVQRKVLADVSNIRGSFAKPSSQDKSKSLCVPSKLAADTWSASSSSSKPLTANARTNLTGATGGQKTSKKSACKDVKATSNDLRSETQGRKLVSSAISRTSGSKHLPPTRTSLPVSRQVNKANPDIKEESTERLEGSRGKFGFPVKPKVSRSVASQISYTRNHHWKTRVSDGYIRMASNGQSNLDGGASSRTTKLARSSVKTKTTVVKDPMTSKSNVIFGLNKLEANTTTSKENMEKSSSSEHAASNLINEPAQQLCSLCKSNTATTTVDATTKRKSGRRKSFTSLLVSKSKEELPNIYDDHNHLEVSEYVDDIYQYYWVMEAQKHPSKDYTETQSEMTPQMRGILINWLIEVHTKFDLMQETLFLMVTLLDQYLSLVSIKKSEMQLVGLTALLLASKYEDFWHPKIMDLISVSAEPYTRTQMLQMESAFLRTLNFRLNAPTSFVFMLRLLKAAQSGKKFEHLAFYLIELCLVELEALNYKPSLLCASAVYLARCTMRMTPAWTPLLEKHSRYEESQIRNCAEMILKFQKGAKTGLLKVTCEKYMKVEFNKVAAIAPLEMLP